jgi:hypothetical protein
MSSRLVSGWAALGLVASSSSMRCSSGSKGGATVCWRFRLTRVVPPAFSTFTVTPSVPGLGGVNSRMPWSVRWVVTVPLLLMLQSYCPTVGASAASSTITT